MYKTEGGGVYPCNNHGSDNADNGADYHLSESSDETDHDYNQKRRGKQSN